MVSGATLQVDIGNIWNCFFFFKFYKTRHIYNRYLWTSLCKYLCL